MKYNSFLYRTLFICSWLTIVNCTANFAQPQSYVSYCSFYAPERGPYIELYLLINGKTVEFSMQENKEYRASIEVSIDIKQNNQSIYTDKYNLHHQTTDSIIPDNLSILDLQRIPLANGEYDLFLAIKDLHSAGPNFLSSQKISVSYIGENINMSDIELIESYTPSKETSNFTKGGYHIVPYTSNFIPASVHTLSFYNEIYQGSSAKGNKFIANYYLENVDNAKILDPYFRFKRLDTSAVNIMFNSLNIEKLASGNYNLVMEVKNKNNQTVAIKKAFFQRSNPQSDSIAMAQLYDLSQAFVTKITNKDSLREYIQCLYPISSDYERKYASNQLELQDVKLMQQYFFSFWQKRNSLAPEEAWKNYYAEVLRVNNDFGSKIRKGYETDRGRVYLQYGAPNQRTKVEHEPNTYPYEIWQYYKLTDSQSNKKFVFCNTDLITNEYALIHSDARGEKYNAQWNIILHKRHSTITDPDATNEQDYYGSKSLEYYQNPR